MAKYYDLHVFYSKKNGFSVPIKADTKLDDDGVTELAVKLDKIDSEDANHVDYVEEIDEQQYLDMGGKL